MRKLVKLIYYREKCAQNGHFGLCSFHKVVSKRLLLNSSWCCSLRKASMYLQFFKVKFLDSLTGTRE